MIKYCYNESKEMKNSKEKILRINNPKDKAKYDLWRFLN